MAKQLEIMVPPLANKPCPLGWSTFDAGASRAWNVSSVGRVARALSPLGHGVTHRGTICKPRSRVGSGVKEAMKKKKNKLFAKMKKKG